MLRRYLRTVPYRSRPALYYESLYSIGRGAFVALLPLSWVVLKTVLDGELWQLTALGCIWGLSGLLAPGWAYLGRVAGLQRLVVWPNMVAGLALAGVVLVSDATAFVLVVSLAYLVAVPSRLTEMSLYRIFYPDSHRSLAVGWLKGIAFVTGALATLAGTWLIDAGDALYGIIYVVVGVLLVGSARSYGRIRIPARVKSLSDGSIRYSAALRQGLKALLADRSFLLYQGAFFSTGWGNFMSMVLVAEVMRESLDAPVWAMGLAVAILPQVLQPISSPLWGRFLDRVNPMQGRAVFSFSMAAVNALYCFGGLHLLVWPFLAGSLIQGLTSSGNQIVWTTGSLYFARPRQVVLYNTVHVALTGFRGLAAPLVGAWLFSRTGLGSWVFGLSSLLGLLGLISMVWLHLKETEERRLSAADRGSGDL